VTPALTLRLQLALVALGYPLPRWGADGHWGSETSAALAAWESDQTQTVALEGLALVELLERQTQHLTAALPGDRILDVRDQHAGRARKGRNVWAKIDTVVLHQMACAGPGPWTRWRDLAIHFAALRSGVAAWLYDCDTLLWHGHGWNGRSVGIEVEGWYAGVAGDPSTLWTPRGATGERAREQQLSPDQAEAARQAIRLAVATVAAHGGEVRYLAAHRQSYAEKQSDPGSAIWGQVALPLLAELGLTTAPTLRGGSPIPEAWDPAQVGVQY